MYPAVHFCSVCGAPVVQEVPAGDNLLRHVCTACRTVHYQNPRMIVGTLPIWEDQVLLCRRAIEPRLGYWTLPAGFMEKGESLEQAAARETSEEAGCPIELKGLFSLISIPKIHQVHFFYLAHMTATELNPGEETLEARLFSEDELPWDDLAFHSVTFTLRKFFEDRRNGHYNVHSTTLEPAA